MGTTSATERLAQPEDTVLRLVREKLLRTTDLMDAAGEYGLSEADMREAVWSLLDEGQLELTRDRHLVPRDAS